MRPTFPSPLLDPKASAKELEERRCGIVADVVDRRLAQVGMLEADDDGRLLATWGCNYSLGSGETANVTTSFFDEYDLPPWELWLAYDTPPTPAPYPGPALIAWIPRELEALVEAGMDACPVSCIVWLDGGHRTARVRPT